MKRIFGAAPAVKTKLVVRKHDFCSAQTAYQRARSAPATHLSCPPHAKETTFYYRLELGSFRRADRKFLVRVSAADGAEAGIIPCLTPPLLVLSKTKPLDASAPLSPPTELPDGLRRGQRPAGRKRTRPCGKPSPLRRHRRSLISTQAPGQPSAPSIPPPSRSGAQSTSRSSRSIADSRISRDRSPILRCGSAHTLLLSPCRRRRRVPNLLIM